MHCFYKLIAFLIYTIFHFISAEKDIVAAARHCDSLYNGTDAGKALHRNQTADQDAKCYYKCYLQELNWMDDDGNMREEPDVVLGEELSQHASTCKNATGTDPCDKAFNFYSCFFEYFRKQQDQHFNSYD